MDGGFLKEMPYNQAISTMAVTSYEFYYFELHGLSRVCRLMLDLSGVKWTDTYVKVYWYNSIKFIYMFEEPSNISAILRRIGMKKRSLLHFFVHLSWQNSTMTGKRYLSTHSWLIQIVRKLLTLCDDSFPWRKVMPSADTWPNSMATWVTILMSLLLLICTMRVGMRSN